MAEPARLRRLLSGVGREFDASRLEKQLLARAFNLVLEVVLKTREGGARLRGSCSWHRTVAASRMKGTQS
jgi:hypothetical protein